MKNRECEMNTTNCCPLCRGEEYLISENGEKFICATCGYSTSQLTSIKAAIYREITQTSQYMHISDNTLH